MFEAVHETALTPRLSLPAAASAERNALSETIGAVISAP
jgi:hypothetical protein